MVSKCANPDCAVLFRYFRQGKLFRFEAEAGPERRRTMGTEGGNKKQMHRLEFYWLCEECASKLTLIWRKGIGVSVRPHLAARASAA
jgi:hypothetical protein